MHYKEVVEASFITRRSRFSADLHIDGNIVQAHVKSTARMKELLMPDAKCILQAVHDPKRRTAYDLIAVQKGDMLVNIDSQAPNKVFSEWATGGGLGFVPDLLRGEVTYGRSRFDYYMESAGKRIYAEVKGVTLEENGIAYFPDAPTERGLKHVYELIDAILNGYEAHLCFVIQLKGATLFKPNARTDIPFCKALKAARDAGVKMHAVDCVVTPDTLIMDRPVLIDID